VIREGKKNSETDLVHMKDLGGVGGGKPVSARNSHEG